MALAWRGRSGWAQGRQLWFLLLPLVSAVAVVALHSQSAAVLQVSALHLRPDVEGGTITIQFGQSLGSAVARASAALETNWPLAVLALLVCAGPALVMAVFYVVARAGQLTAGELVAVAASVVSPLVLLVIATDLSRFMVVTNVVVLLVLLLLESRSRAAPRVTRTLSVVVVFVCVLSLVAPLVYVDEEAATLWRFGPMAVGLSEGSGIDAEPVSASTGILGG